jgi:hypothetical protein
MTPDRHQSHTCVQTEGSMLCRALLGTLCAPAEPSSTSQKDGRVHRWSCLHVTSMVQKSTPGARRANGSKSGQQARAAATRLRRSADC